MALSTSAGAEVQRPLATCCDRRDYHLDVPDTLCVASYLSLVRENPLARACRLEAEEQVRWPSSENAFLDRMLIHNPTRKPTNAPMLIQPTTRSVLFRRRRKLWRSSVNDPDVAQPMFSFPDGCLNSALRFLSYSQAFQVHFNIVSLRMLRLVGSHTTRAQIPL